ncbi:MAG: AIM24 family protein [Acidobacteriota bacterium]
MADFEIIEQEGLRLVKISLNSETVRTESGALYYMHGPIEMQSKGPSGVGGLFKALASGENIFRPTYTGTGELFLEPSFGGFHVMELTGQEWILEGGCYYASEEGVEVGVHREKALTALKSGEGFLDYQTKIGGHGKVVVATPGPVEELTVRGKLVVDGRYVLARPVGMGYEVQRATKSLLGSLTSGEGLVRTFTGNGKVLFAPIPYWRQRLFAQLSSSIAAARARK